MADGEVPPRGVVPDLDAARRLFPGWHIDITMTGGGEILRYAAVRTEGDGSLFSVVSSDLIEVCDILRGYG